MIQLFQKSYPELTGNWEEPGVVGTRIEIEKNRVLILWRNAPVLDSTFTVEKTPERVLRLKLRETGLRYQGSASDYAAVTELYWQEGKLHYLQQFPITGPSETVLERTEKSRFGNYTDVSKEILPELRGSWEDENGSFILTFRGSVLEIDGQRIPVCVLHSNGLPKSEPTYRIVHADPSHYEVHCFGSVDYIHGVLTAVIPVCDAPSMTLTFHKR